MRLINILLLSLLASPLFANVDSSLNIGDKAPALQVKFVKGKPVTRFQKGRVYVLEFWATWCGPCKKAMPHVSEVSRKFADKVDVIGISVWERAKKDQDIPAQVTKFVQSNDSIMDFNVAMEDGEKMAKTWLEPAGVIGIPATMIIDAQGQVAWIGAPWDVETPLAELLQGRYDMKKYALKYKEEQDKNKQMMADYKQVRPLADSMKKLVDANSYNDAIKVYDGALALNPRLKEYLFGYYMVSLAVTAPDKGYEVLAAMADSNVMYSVASSLAAKEGLQARYYKWVVALLEPEAKEIGAWTPLASASFYLGDVEKAIVYQQQFVDFLTAATNKGPAGFYEGEQEKLKKYKEALKK